LSCKQKKFSHARSVAISYRSKPEIETNYDWWYRYWQYGWVYSSGSEL